eukprot:7065226-Pyramimonas_sp.AAC.1
MSMVGHFLTGTGRRRHRAEGAAAARASSHAFPLRLPWGLRCFPPTFPAGLCPPLALPPPR